MRVSYKTIALTASLLLILLLTLTKSPIEAKASKQVFATIQHVNNAIATALSPLTIRVSKLGAIVTPIPAEIANLQTAQSNQVLQINSLGNRVSGLENSSSSAKQFIVFDANNQRLGILMAGAELNGLKTIYNEKIGKILTFGQDGSIRPEIGAYYTTSDCTGTAYLSSYFNDYFFSIARGELAIVDSSATPTSQLIRSEISTGIGSTTCSSINQTIDDLIPLIKMPYPYPSQIKSPVKIKYQ